MDPAAKIQKRGYQLIDATDNQLKKGTPTLKGAWPDGRLDLNPLAARDLGDVANLANLFLERNKSNKEEHSSYLNTVQFENGDFGWQGRQNAETDCPAVDLEQPTLENDGNEVCKVVQSDANSHPADAFTESSWAISSELFVEVEHPVPVYFSGVNGARLIGKISGPDRDSDLMVIRTPSDNIVGCTRSDYTLEASP
jgi:hypothetical protein